MAIERALRRSSLYKKACVILCYVSIDGEVETRPILKEALADGKRVAVPALRKKSHRLVAAEISDAESDLEQTGPFKIPQPRGAHRRPIPPEALDLIIVPGVAFDCHGRRLGRGGGYFDRFLSRVPLSVPRIGIAFRFQVVKELVTESHDQPVTKVITD